MGTLIELLRAATEDDVEAARKDAHFGEVLDEIEPAVLLEFHNRMLDRTLGQDADNLGIALLPPEPTQH